MPIILTARLGRAFYGHGGCVTVISFHGLLLENRQRAVLSSPCCRKWALPDGRGCDLPRNKSALRQNCPHVVQASIPICQQTRIELRPCWISYHERYSFALGYLL